MGEQDGLARTACDRLTEILSARHIPDPDTELNQAEILELAADCQISELNVIILDLNRRAAQLRRQGYGLRTIATTLTDEVRRRAERLEEEAGK